MTVKEFITQVFLHEYKKIIDGGFHYISFALIGLGIEFLGACLDAHEFSKRGKSRNRFIRGVQLFPKKYHRYPGQLYDDFRSGFAHQMRPGAAFVLTHREESLREGTSHLGRWGNQTVLVCEDFYDDFTNACTEVISRIDKGTLSHPKLTGPYLKV